MTIRACLRISVHATESQSLDQQRHLITRWAEYKHPDEPIEFYVDPGVSGGKPLAERPEGARLLADLRSGDTLAVTKIDRLARNVADFLDTLNRCEKVDAKFVATEQDVSTEGAYGRFMLILLGALAELEKGIVRERTLAARAQFLRDGRHGVGQLPYGFHAVRDEDKGWLVVRPHPEQGPNLRAAVLNVTRGATQMSQAAALGLPEPTFRGLLTNTRLYGQTPGEGGKLDKESGIISMAEWRQLQDRIGGPRSWSRAPGYGQAMRCYQCDGRMYLDTASERYKCDTRPRHTGRPTIQRSLVDEHIESYFLQYYGDAPVVRVYTADDGDRQERLAEVEIALDQVTTRLRDMDDDDDELYGEVRELKRRRKEIAAEPIGNSISYEETGETYRELWGHEDDQARVHMLSQTVKFIVHPAGRPEGRIDVEELIPSTEEHQLYILAPMVSEQLEVTGK